MPLTISPKVQRQFILGQQGLYPGRRWQGKAGLAEAIQSSCVVQVDPLSVIARNHDIALYERVIDYRPADLDNFLYTQRKGFDWGGVVMIHPMTELPYWRALMARRIKQPRFAKFLAEHPTVIDTVYETIRERGPLSNRDFPAPKTIISIHFRSPKDTGLALYYLWMAGELMTHSRKGVERIYDLRERIAPPEFDYVASPDDADNFFMFKVFHELGIVSPRSFRNGFYGIVERKVAPSEATERLAALLEAGKIVEIRLDADKKNTPLHLVGESPASRSLNCRTHTRRLAAHRNLNCSRSDFSLPVGNRQRSRTRSKGV